MTALTSFRLTPYQNEADLAAIADLINACEAVDRLDEGTSVAELKEDFANPDFDLVKDLRLWRDGEGKLLASADLWRPTPDRAVQGYLSFYVHPEVRNQGLENDIIAWAKARLMQTAQGINLPVQLDVACRDTLVDRIALCERHSFVPERYFIRMGRSLSDPIPTPEFPEGFTVRAVNAETDAEAWVELFNQSFIDHWNHHDLTLQDFHYYCGLSHYRADLNMVAIAPDGTFAAFCEGVINPADNARTGREEGYLSIIGSRRGFRRQGLGRAMLLVGLQRLQAAGMDMAVLGVDAENPSGALGLYQSVGFEQQRRTIVFRKTLL